MEIFREFENGYMWRLPNLKPKEIVAELESKGLNKDEQIEVLSKLYYLAMTVVHNYQKEN